MYNIEERKTLRKKVEIILKYISRIIFDSLLIIATNCFKLQFSFSIIQFIVIYISKDVWSPEENECNGDVDNIGFIFSHFPKCCYTIQKKSFEFYLWSIF